MHHPQRPEACQRDDQQPGRDKDHRLWLLRDHHGKKGNENFQRRLAFIYVPRGISTDPLLLEKRFLVPRHDPLPNAPRQNSR